MNILEVYIKDIYVWMANTTQYGRRLVPQKTTQYGRGYSAIKHLTFKF